MSEQEQREAQKEVEIKKVRNKKTTLIVGIATIGVLGVLGGVYLSSNSRKVKGFEGVGTIKDSMEVQLDTVAKSFDIATAELQPNEIRAGGTADNIEAFKIALEENISKEKGNKLQIPAASVFFDFNSSSILNQGNELLNEYAKVYMKTNKQAKLVVSGYTCDLGSDDANMKVANQRASEVKAVLVSAGVPEENIITHGYGESKYQEFFYSDKKDYRRVILSIGKE